MNVRRPRIETAQLSVRISRSLRSQLEQRREASGRSLSLEVEAQLRRALRAKPSNGMILLPVDDGLLAWLEASAGDIFGDLEQTAVYLLRSGLLDLIKSENWRRSIAPRLREPYRSAALETLRFE